MAEFAVLGSPIDHSLSPLLHTAAASALQLSDFRYSRYDLAEDVLAAFLDEHLDLVGLSLTMPLKHRLVELARERGWRVDADAEATGAGNTLVRLSDGTGDVLNTDVVGITEAVTEALSRAHMPGVPWGEEADVLGAGATAGSALTAAARLGISRVRLFVRNRNRAGDARIVAEALGLETEVCDLPDWVPGERGLTLSTLPSGALDPVFVALPQRIDALIFDVAYAASSAPLHSALLERGALVVDGSRMLVHQAVAQHVRFAQLAGLSADEALAAAPTILVAMESALRDR